MTLFQLTRPLVTLDLETTGLRVELDRIVEIGMMTEYPDGSCAECGGDGTVLDAPADVLAGRPYRDACSDCKGTGRRPSLEWRTLVNPTVPIPAQATAVHGITDAMVRACRVCGYEMPKAIGNEPVNTHCPADTPMHEFKPWPTFAQLAPRLAKFLHSVDFAGKNVRFDLQMLGFEMQRAKAPWSYADAAIVCADAIERVREPRHLSDLYRRLCRKEPLEAHSALNDVKMAAEVLDAQLALMPEFPRTPAEAHALLWADWIDSNGKFRFDQQGIPIVWFGKHRGSPMAEVPGDYWNYILKNDFDAESKALASKAKLREFPTKGAS